jgi:mono/diheme cytochrome c family protein
MRRLGILLTLPVCIAFGAGTAHAQTDEAISGPRAFLEQTCIQCHSAEAESAMALFSGFFLDRLDVEHVAQAPEEWEKVVRKLRTGMMPPASEPRPDPIAAEQFVTYLEAELDRFAARNPNPGRPALHRLNRTEYANVIRDLLQLEVDPQELLPGDDSSFGFDNVAGSLGISPVLIERYANAAAKISRLAVGDLGMTAELTTHYVPNFLMQSEHIDGLPFGSRGGIRVEHFFPLDAEYSITADLMSAVNGIHIGNGVPNEQLEISLDGLRIALFDISKPPPRPPAAEEQDDAESGDQAEAGDAVAAEDDAPAAPEAMEKEGEQWEVRVPVSAGPHTLMATFIKKNHAPIEDIIQQPNNTLLDPLFNGTPDVTLIAHVGSLAVDGPYEPTNQGNTPSRQKIFTCRPKQPSEEDACAREIISTLAYRAYRQRPSTEHVSVLMDFFQSGRAAGDFDKGIEVALQRILSSPQFVFRFERDPADVTPEQPYRISDTELASRLAFFLWSSIPDDELLDLASRNRLSRPAVLEQQVARMLADPRSRALTENFAGQWLYLRNLQIKDASTFEFPDFDDNLRHSFRRETELLFEHIVRNNRSVLDLLTADYTFVDERLAKHYGMPGIYGSHFRQVQVDDPRRQGVLGHGSILLVTSQPNRTSPVTRGVWVLENILGAHVPLPPPVTIPALEEAAGDADFDSLSVRELMELHRSKPFCEGCHKIMDPVGLAMENYDVIGRWRTMDGDTPIDASGQLVDGTKINGPVELRQALLRYSDQIVSNMTEKLITYALGRGVEYYDMPVVRSITADAAEDDYRFSSIVMGIVTSAPFQMRASEHTADGTVAAGRE